MTASKQTIPVEIQGRQYRIRSDGDQQLVKRAALMVDETMSKLRKRASAVDSLDVAVLAALNLANQFISSRDEAQVEERYLDDDREQLQALIDLVEAALPEGSLAPH